MTLVEFASTFVAFKAKRCKPATVAEYQRILKLRLLPRFDARDLRRISTSDAALLHAEPARNSRVQANRTVSALCRVLKVARLRGLKTRHTNVLTAGKDGA
jgi:hypothetical protein